MKVKGWMTGIKERNVNTGSGFYITLVSLEDRDLHFKKEWKTVEIELPNGKIAKPRLKPSFWKPKTNTSKPCLELRQIEIGKWMIDNKFAPWPRNLPPVFELESKGNQKFKLHLI